MAQTVTVIKKITVKMLEPSEIDSHSGTFIQINLTLYGKITIPEEIVDKY